MTEKETKNTTPPQVEPATLNKKLGAWLYDLLICIAIWFLWSMFTFPIIRWLLGVEDMKSQTGWESDPVYLIYKWIPSLLVLLYIAGSHYKYGHTVGMGAWRLRLVKEDGKAVTFGQSIIRTMVSVLGIGMLISPLNRKKQGWHDIVAKTRVVQLEKR